MLIISDSPIYLLSSIGKKNGLVINSFLDFPISSNNSLSGNNSDILLLISEYFYKNIANRNLNLSKKNQEIKFVFNEIERIIKDAEKKGNRVFFPLIPTHYLYVGKNFQNYSYSQSSEFDIYKINTELVYKFQNFTNVIFLQGLKHIDESISKEYFRFSSIYNKKNSEIIINQLKLFYYQEKLKNKKLIILDLDNTLWKGIVGEDSLSGIRMDQSDHIGAIYYQVQRLLLNLKDNGFLLAICSKNNEETGLEALFNHPSSQFKPEDVVSYKINWKEKSENIIDICKELNLSLLETIFIDDSVHECDEVSKNCKGITVIKVPSNIYKYPSLILNEPSLNIGISTFEDKKRTTLYKEGIQRKELLNKTLTKKGTHIDWIKSLKIELNIEVISKSSRNMQRILQLFNRTNQFHLSGNKFNIDSFLNQIESSDNIYFQVNLKDRLGSEGLISVIGIETNHKYKNINIIDFILSCRVFGRMVEKVMLIPILKYAQNLNYEVNFLLQKNPRNIAVQNFLKNDPFKSTQISTNQLNNIINDFEKLPLNIKMEKNIFEI